MTLRTVSHRVKVQRVNATAPSGVVRRLPWSMKTRPWPSARVRRTGSVESRPGAGWIPGGNARSRASHSSPLTVRTAWRSSATGWCLGRGAGYLRGALRVATTWAFTERDLGRARPENSGSNVAFCQGPLGGGYCLEGTRRSAFRTPEGVRHDEQVDGRLSTDRFPHRTRRPNRGEGRAGGRVHLTACLGLSDQIARARDPPVGILPVMGPWLCRVRVGHIARGARDIVW